MLSLYMEPNAIAILKDTLRSLADERFAKYPQYQNHWSGPEWKLGIATKDVRTKSGLAFSKGERFLVKVGDVIENGPYVGMIGFTGYSPRNGCDTAIRPESFRFIEGVARWAEPIK